MNHILLNAGILLFGTLIGVISASSHDKLVSDLMFYLLLGIMSLAVIHYAWMVFSYKEELDTVANRSET